MRARLARPSQSPLTAADWSATFDTVNSRQPELSATGTPGMQFPIADYFRLLRGACGSAAVRRRSRSVQLLIERRVLIAGEAGVSAGNVPWLTRSVRGLTRCWP